MIAIGAIIGIVFLILVSPRLCRSDKIASLIFVVINLLHEMISYSHTGLLYYCGGALSQLIIITITNITVRPTKLALRLQYLCLLSIIVDFAGWIAWFSYLNHEVYNIAFYCIYVAAALQIIGITGNGKYRIARSSCRRFWANFYRGILHDNKRKGSL